VFTIEIISSVNDGCTSAEIYFGEQLIAIVYERVEGWKVDLFVGPCGLSLDEFVKALDAAKAHLEHYVNRRGESAPEGLTAAGLSLWLMEKTDGTAMGVNLNQSPE
jgi:hypothetical protein